MKFLKIAILAILIVSCAPIRVNYDYDKTTSFNSYKTYQFYADMETGLSELDTKRLLNAIDAKMQSKGFSFSETPDFFIDIKSQEYQEPQRQTVGVGVGGGGGNVGGGISIGLPIGQANVNRQITIDFVDENKKQLFWQAVSESSFNPKSTPEKREARLNAIAEKVLNSYPPESK
ncbi:DUF4136 domain-containing protein [Algibacter amylolyticus]|uniref:DUF4136 domain-containing protein n=1 Tax=Algibacter amylolyticus TaxID=1608400 RepID=A0A5M7BLT0_9FLAO|nr:DUF4136 domain-containing protein [Algibacter amylolyticus]KAA5828121.1 DUF4136 domain-containing protein [Algibacter amylolyticus]MBB5267369.1 hypothetical protein [Algibacter amylolyticus]TSJ82366.1 DUF4136 domain-containing protein [Algibacter amylolyticus]